MKMSQVSEVSAQAAEAGRSTALDAVPIEPYKLAPELLEKASILEAETTGKEDTL